MLENDQFSALLCCWVYYIDVMNKFSLLPDCSGRAVLVFLGLLLPFQLLCQQDCQDLGDVDFGLCDMAMGIALVDGSCVSVSGCGWEVGGVDYSPYFYTNIEDCIACDQDECVDSTYVNPNMPCLTLWDPVCGCNGVTYGNSCEAIFGGGVTLWFPGECGDCIDPSLQDPLVDCSPFDPEPVCGCDSLTHFSPCVATYMDWVSTYAAGGCAGDCVDSTRVVPDFGCPEVDEPVCGCDNVTYGNACEAWYWGGLASWTEGPCDNVGVQQQAQAKPALALIPNPTTGTFTIHSAGQPVPADLPWTLLTVTGKAVLTGRGPAVHLPANRPAGIYFLRPDGQAPVRLIKE